MSIRAFLDYAVHRVPPDHSTLSRTRRLIDLKTHQAVCTWVLQRLADATLVVGRTVGIDATTLEANAAMRRIVRRCQRSFKIPPPAVQLSVAIDITASRRCGYALQTTLVALEQLDRTSH